MNRAPRMVTRHDDAVSHLSAFASNDLGYAVITVLTVSLLAVLKIGGWL